MSDASSSDTSGERLSSAGLPSRDEVSQEELDEIEAERKRRLDPDNRPELAEVDNTDREFDLERGEFVDAEADEADAGH